MSQNTNSNTTKLPHRWKSTLADALLTVIGSKDEDGLSMTDVPIRMRIRAYELDYGPVIDLEIKCKVAYEPGIWIDHPLRIVYDKNSHNTKYDVSEIIDDTPATRALIEELANPNSKKLYTTTDCSHRAALIASLRNFWS